MIKDIVIAVLALAVVYLLYVNWGYSVLLDAYVTTIAEMSARIEEVFSNLIAYETKYGKIDAGTSSVEKT